MDKVLVLLILGCLIAIVIGLVKPGLVIKWGEKKTRPRVLVFYGGLFIVLFIALGMTGTPEKDNSHGNKPSVANAAFPVFNPEYTKEHSYEYPVSFNGRLRFKRSLDLELKKEEIEKMIREDERTQKYTEGKAIKKIIVVPGKIINIVV